MARIRSSGTPIASRSAASGVGDDDMSSTVTFTPIDPTRPSTRSPFTSSTTSRSIASGRSPSGARRSAARSSSGMATSPVHRLRQSRRPDEIRGSPGRRCPSEVTSSPGMGNGWWFGFRSSTAWIPGNGWSFRSGTGVPATERSAMRRSSSVTNQPHREIEPSRSITRKRSGTEVHSFTVACPCAIAGPTAMAPRTIVGMARRLGMDGRAFGDECPARRPGRERDRTVARFPRSEGTPRPRRSRRRPGPVGVDDTTDLATKGRHLTSGRSGGTASASPG